MTKTERKEKILYILSERSNREAMSDDFYKDLYLLYLFELENEEIETEFNFYLQNKNDKIYPSLDTKVF